jgi:hypothetical protein
MLILNDVVVFSNAVVSLKTGMMRITDCVALSLLASDEIFLLMLRESPYNGSPQS